MNNGTQTTSQEEMLERQLARCAEVLETCLDSAASAQDRCMEKRRDELHAATRLMNASARLAGALARMRDGTRHTITVERGIPPTKKRGSNGQANR